jgi:hypothetical protein
MDGRLVNIIRCLELKAFMGPADTLVPLLWCTENPACSL